MDVIEATTTEAHGEIIERLSEREERSSRAGDMREDLCVLVRSPNPRDRYLARPGYNLAFNLQEHWAYWMGENPGYVQRYNTNMETWLDENGELPGSAYGDRLRNTAGHDQLRRLRKQLEESPDTRRAMAMVHQPAVEDYDSNDVACTAYLHPLLRDGELHMVAALRSQDMHWGYPYDTANNQWLQEVLAGLLGVEVGEYWHLMDSCHYYTDYEDEALEAARTGEGMIVPDCRRRQESFNQDFMHLTDGLSVCREGFVPSRELAELGGFYHDWLALMTAYDLERFHGKPGKSADVAATIGCDDWRAWMEGRLE